ncbi:response regulator [Deltaproteobacteria bacterium TL4]
MGKILIVDDDPQVFQHLRALLQQYGYEYGFITHPKYVFQRLEDDAFDLILLDLNMPEIGGITILKQLKEAPKFQAIPVIILTGESDSILLQECFEFGAIDFINKPIDEIILRSRIKSAMATQGYIRQLEDEIIKRKRLEKYLRQSEKMEAIRTLSGGIAHEYNNMLFSILGYAQLLTEDTPKEMTTAHDSLRRIIHMARRAQKLTAQILAFSRYGQAKLHACPIIEVIKDAIDYISVTLEPNVRLEYESQIMEGSIMAVPSQISQLLTNLCANACYAMKDSGGDLTIGLNVIKLNRNELSSPEMEEGDYFELTVTDTGCGIAEDQLDHIFNPFFTTKPVGQGTGMGLSVVHGIVEHHRGHISVKSVLNEGSSFTILFPKNG